MAKQNTGTVVQIIGPVLDIRFEAGSLPRLLDAVEIVNNGERLIAEVAQHIGDDTVRCIAMSSTDGLVRGIEAVDTGSPITVPVGRETLGRVFNLLGEPVDDKPRLKRRSVCRSIGLPLLMRSRRRPTRCWKPESRS